MIAQQRAEAVPFVGESARPVVVPEHNGRAQADLSGNKEYPTHASSRSKHRPWSRRCVLLSFPASSRRRQVSWCAHHLMMANAQDYPSTPAYWSTPAVGSNDQEDK